jgi:hypothetical protein
VILETSSGVCKTGGAINECPNYIGTFKNEKYLAARRCMYGRSPDRAKNEKMV